MSTVSQNETSFCLSITPFSQLHFHSKPEEQTDICVEKMGGMLLNIIGGQKMTWEVQLFTPPQNDFYIQKSKSTESTV